MVAQSALLVPRFREREELDIRTLGQIFSASGFFQDAKEAAQAMTKILAGRELGIGPLAAMTGIYLVKGRITLSAALVAGLIKRSARYDYRVKRLDNEACTIAFLEGGEVLGESSFTREDAVAAGLWGQQGPWKQYPRNMLYARALTSGARWYCPDIFAGPVYTPEELGAAVDGETGEPVVDLSTGEVVDAATERPPALVRALAAWSDEALKARANGIEPDERDLDAATPEELRDSALRLAKLRAAATEEGWPALFADAANLGLDPVPLPELTTPRHLRAMRSEEHTSELQSLR